MPPHRVLGVFLIGCCGFWLSKAGRAPAKDAPLLPPGAGYILTQCAIYSIMTKVDQTAAKAVTPTEHVFWSKLLVGLWAGFGALTMARGTDAAAAASKEGGGRGPVSRSVGLLLTDPRLLLLLLTVASIEGIYMGVYSIALKTISKVYVIAIKIGGCASTRNLRPHCARTAPAPHVPPSHHPLRPCCRRHWPLHASPPWPRRHHLTGSPRALSHHTVACRHALHVGGRMGVLQGTHGGARAAHARHRGRRRTHVGLDGDSAHTELRVSGTHDNRQHSGVSSSLLCVFFR